MWRNYWTVAVRALAKSKTYSIINIAGLAIGMAACIMILLYINYERSYDKWLPDVENTYQLQAWYPHPSLGGEPGFLQMSGYVTKDRVKKDFPQIQSAVYVQSTDPVFLKDGEATSTKDWYFADDDALKVINLPLAAGTTLTAPQTAAITQDEAIKRYGTDQVVGRTLTIISRGIRRDFKITGLLKNLPKNSSMKLDAVLRLDFGAFYADTPLVLTGCWGCQNGWVYLRLRPGADANAINAGLRAWERRAIPDENAGEAHFNAGDDQDWHVVNVQDVHLGRAQAAAMAPGNDRTTIVTFSIVALLILGMAVVNFTNLATARASQRAREVALRKVLASHSAQFTQGRLMVDLAPRLPLADGFFKPVQCLGSLMQSLLVEHGDLVERVGVGGRQRDRTREGRPRSREITEDGKVFGQRQMEIRVTRVDAQTLLNQLTGLFVSLPSVSWRTNLVERTGEVRPHLVTALSSESA